MNTLDLLAINLTKRCNLACAHCYLDAETRTSGGRDELGTGDVFALLDQVADRSTETMVVLTGGEPLLRGDIEDMVRHGANRGLSMVLGTNGTALTQSRAAALSEAGLLGVGISIDSLNPSHHDEFRGVKGCFQKACAALGVCRDHGLAVQIHFTVTAKTLEEIPDVIQFARDEGARVVNFFFLVCTGRGESMTDISPDEYEKVLHQIIKAQADNEDLIIRPRCAPHFKRVAHQLAPQAAVNSVQGSDGCIAGTHYCRVTPSGGITVCPYVATELGNIRDGGFFNVWDEAAGFQALRQPALAGKCGVCEYQQLCGGCRARGFAATGDMMAQDDLCAYVPAGKSILIPFEEELCEDLSWSLEAARRVARIPGFVRKMVKRKVEACAAEQGDKIITCAHLDTLTAKRFGGTNPIRPPVKRVVEVE